MGILRPRGNSNCGEISNLEDLWIYSSFLLSISPLLYSSRFEISPQLEFPLGRGPGVYPFFWLFTSCHCHPIVPLGTLRPIGSAEYLKIPLQKFHHVGSQDYLLHRGILRYSADPIGRRVPSGTIKQWRYWKEKWGIYSHLLHRHRQPLRIHCIPCATGTKTGNLDDAFIYLTYFIVTMVVFGFMTFTHFWCWLEGCCHMHSSNLRAAPSHTLHSMCYRYEDWESWRRFYLSNMPLEFTFVPVAHGMQCMRRGWRCRCNR
jgi:hypothetical protein